MLIDEIHETATGVVILSILLILQCKRKISETDRDHVYMLPALERPAHIWNEWQR